MVFGEGSVDTPRSSSIGWSTQGFYVSNYKLARVDGDLVPVAIS